MMDLSGEAFIVTVVIIQICICLIGYFGNIITCIIIISHKSMHTATNLYLCNLAIADFILLSVGITEFTIPAWYLAKNEFKDLGHCDIRVTISETAFHASIMTIMAFTIERYLAICHPFLARRILSIWKAVKLIFFIWVIGLLFGYLIGSQYISTFGHHGLGGFHQNDTEAICTTGPDVNLKYFFNTQSLIFFILPLFVLTVLYILIWKELAESSKILNNTCQGTSKLNSLEKQNDDDSANRKTFKMLITVVAVFFIAWAPYHIFRFWAFNADHLVISQSLNDVDFFNNGLLLSTISSTAYFLSASVNPFVYSIFSNKFRYAFKEVFLKHWHNQRKQVRFIEKVLEKQDTEDIETGV